MVRREKLAPSRGFVPTTVGTHTAARHAEGKPRYTRVDDRDSSLIAPDDTVSSGVEPQSTLQGFFPRAVATLTRRWTLRPRHYREKSAPPGHVSCSSIRKSTPGYLGSGPKYTAHTGGFLALLFFPSCRWVREGDDLVVFTWERASTTLAEIKSCYTRNFFYWEFIYPVGIH